MRERVTVICSGTVNDKGRMRQGYRNLNNAIGHFIMAAKGNTRKGKGTIESIKRTDRSSARTQSSRPEPRTEESRAVQGRGRSIVADFIVVVILLELCSTVSISKMNSKLCGTDQFDSDRLISNRLMYTRIDQFNGFLELISHKSIIGLWLD